MQTAPAARAAPSAGDLPEISTCGAPPPPQVTIPIPKAIPIHRGPRRLMVDILGPVAFDRESGAFPVDEAAGKVTDVGVAPIAQLLNDGQAGVAILIRTVNDDLFVLAQRREHLLGRLEMDRPGQVLGAKSPVAGRHHQLEAIAARELGAQLLTIEDRDPLAV